MARTYLDYDGLLYFWEKLKSKLSAELSEKVDEVSGKGLSSNDLTNALVTKINQAEANVIAKIKVNNSEVAPDSSKTVSITVPTDNSQLANGAGYQTAANVSAAIPIKSIKVNGSALTPDSGKAVSITVPTSNSQLSNGAGYQTASDVSAAIASALSGVTSISYQTVTTLPATGAAGVIYLVAHSHGDKDSYDEYLWLGSAYEKIGNTDINLSGYVKTTDLSAISNAQIDTICAT